MHLEKAVKWVLVLAMGSHVDILLKVYTILIELILF